MSLPIPLPAQTAELPGGLHVPYLEQGDPDGIPVVLLHGLTDSHRSFEPVLAELPISIHAYAVTARGHGDAAKPAGGYDAPQMADDVVAFMDAVGVDRAIVAGHSMGAWTARRAAELHPDRVLGLVLAGCFASFDIPDMHELLASFGELGDPIDPDYAREWQLSTLARPVPEDFLDMVVEETCKPPAHVWKAALGGLISDRPAPPKTVTAPTWLIYGEQDALVPREHQDVLLAEIPGSDLTVRIGGGHAFHWEDPARYASELTAFAGSLAHLA
jgi:non-heme chloroperoxidase